MRELTPCLWFDTEAEEAASFYTSVFPNSKVLGVTHYGAASSGRHRDDGELRVERDEVHGAERRARVHVQRGDLVRDPCEDQQEVDLFWSKLTDGGEEGPCGWVKDRFGLSWQIVPTALPRLLADPDPERSQRVMAAMLKMKKIDIDELERAAAAA